MKYPFHSLLFGWLIAISVGASLYEPHHFQPEPDRSTFPINAIEPKATPGEKLIAQANSREEEDAWPVADERKPSSRRDTERESSREASRDASREESREEIRESERAKDGEVVREHTRTRVSEQQTQLAADESVRIESGLIESHDHPLLKGLEIERRYFPLVINQGDQRKYRNQRGNVSYEDDPQRSASGERFKPNELVAAHSRYPMGSILRCTNLSNGKSVVVQVIDRGPYVDGRILDLSEAAGERIGMLRKGVTRCKVEVLAYPQKRAPYTPERKSD